jgi:hypothetical protein
MTEDQHALIMTLGYQEQLQRSFDHIAELEKRNALQKYDQRYLADALADLDRAGLPSTIYQSYKNIVAAARRLTDG